MVREEVTVFMDSGVTGTYSCRVGVLVFLWMPALPSHLSCYSCFIFELSHLERGG